MKYGTLLTDELNAVFDDPVSFDKASPSTKESTEASKLGQTIDANMNWKNKCRTHVQLVCCEKLVWLSGCKADDSILRSL